MVECPDRLPVSPWQRKRHPLDTNNRAISKNTSTIGDATALRSSRWPSDRPPHQDRPPEPTGESSGPTPNTTDRCERLNTRNCDGVGLASGDRLRPRQAAAVGGAERRAGPERPLQLDHHRASGAGALGRRGGGGGSAEVVGSGSGLGAGGLGGVGALGGDGGGDGGGGGATTK